MKLTTLVNLIVISNLFCMLNADNSTVIVSAANSNWTYDYTRDGYLNFTEIAVHCGYLNTEEVEVITEDLYILTMFHIPGDPTKPMALVHGLMDSSDTYILRGIPSLAIFLASLGYDVWAINCRGNKYSQKHENLTVDDDAFWQYTFHQMAVYDLTASIDHILNATGQTSLFTIGHSQGTQIHFVLGTMKPEYSLKIRLFIALAPVCLQYSCPPPVSTLFASTPLLDPFLEALDIHQILQFNSTLNRFIQLACSQGWPSFQICTDGFLGELTGHDPDQLLVGSDPQYDFATKTLYSHFPAGTSRLNLAHSSQVANRREFAQFDYGPTGNLKKYGKLTPPVYNLKLYNIKTALIVGRNDRLAVLEDVEQLLTQLRTVVYYKVMERPKFNHVDFVWGLDMADYLFPLIQNLLKTYKTLPFL